MQSTESILFIYLCALLKICSKNQKILGVWSSKRKINSLKSGNENQAKERDKLATKTIQTKEEAEANRSRVLTHTLEWGKSRHDL